MSKRIDCDRCMRLYREFRPAAVRIADENYCLQCVRSESLDPEDGEPIVQPTPMNTPMGVPKVPDVPAPAPRKAAPVAEKKESEMEEAPLCKVCRKTKMRRTKGGGDYNDECTACKKGLTPEGRAKHGITQRADKVATAKAAPAKRGPKPKVNGAQTSAAPQPVPDMATISVPATFIQKYWASLTLTEQAQLVNQHMLEAH